MKTEEQVKNEQARGIYRNTAEDGASADGSSPQAAPADVKAKADEKPALPPGAKSLEGSPPGPYAYLVQDQGKRRAKRIALWVGLSVLALALLLGIIPRVRRSRENAQAAQAEIKREAAPQVTVAYPKAAPALSELSLPGNIEPLNSTTIGARSTGYVRRYLVDIGDTVRQGQLLAEIETPEVEQQAVQAGAQVAQARGGVSEARANAARSEATIAQARAEVSRLEAALLQARSQRAQAFANVAKAKASAEAQRQNVAQEETNRNLARVTNERYQFLAREGAVGRQEADERRAAFDAAEARVRSARATLKTTLSDIKQFRAALRASDADIQAARQSVKGGIENVRAAQASAQASRAGIQSAQANQQAAQANLQRAQAVAGFNAIRAPFAGVVTARGVDSGALIGGGAGSASGASGGQSLNGLFTIASVDRLRIYVDVPQGFASTVRAGQTAQVTTREYPGRTFAGRIFRTSRSLDPSTRTLRTEVQIVNTDGALLPGMYAQVAMQAPRTAGVLLIPASALITAGQGSQVATVDGDNKVHIVPITVGRDFGREIEVTRGLDARTAIVTNPTDALRDGITVTPKQAEEKKEGAGGGQGQGQGKKEPPGTREGQPAKTDGQIGGGAGGGVPTGDPVPTRGAGASSGETGGAAGSAGSGQITSGAVGGSAGGTGDGGSVPSGTSGQSGVTGQAGALSGDAGAGQTTNAPGSQSGGASGASGSGTGTSAYGRGGSSGTGATAAGQGAGVSGGTGATGSAGGAAGSGSGGQ